MKIYSIKTTLPFSKLAPQTAQNLSSNAFILWCAFYAAGQAQASFDITPQMITKQWGMSRATYYRMLTELQEKRYLVPDRDNYIFYEQPINKELSQ